MFVNPQELLEKKIITFPNSLDISKHLQQNGIDVDCNKLSSIPDRFFINKEGEKEFVGESKEVHLFEDERRGPLWFLPKKTAFTFESSFHVHIPEGMCGWLIGRSSFNRNGILIRSGLYDSGYKGPAGGTLYCLTDLLLGPNTRVAQLVIAKAENASLYDGQYQEKDQSTEELQTPNSHSKL